MLMKTPTTQAVHPDQASQDPVRCITGSKVMKGYRHDKHTRADLAADWKSGVLAIRPTIAMAARAFGTSPYLVKRVLEQRGHLPKRPKVPAIEAAWSKTTRVELEAFILRHFDALYRLLDRATTKLTV